MNKKQDTCGKCYKLDRKQSYCERHKTKILATSGGQHVRCPQCIEEKQKANRNT